MKRFELSTLSLARRCSTTELHPQVLFWRSQKSSLHRRVADLMSMQHSVTTGQEAVADRAELPRFRQRALEAKRIDAA